MYRYDRFRQVCFDSQDILRAPASTRMEVSSSSYINLQSVMSQKQAEQVLFTISPNVTVQMLFVFLSIKSYVNYSLHHTHPKVLGEMNPYLLPDRYCSSQVRDMPRGRLSQPPSYAAHAHNKNPERAAFAPEKMLKEHNPANPRMI